MFLAETRIRPRNEITIPGIVRDVLNLCPGDLVRFEMDEGVVSICKVVTHKVNNMVRRRGYEEG